MFARQQRSRTASIKVISHAEQLALSTCSLRSSTTLWCGSVTIPTQSRQMRGLSQPLPECHGESGANTSKNRQTERGNRLGRLHWMPHAPTANKRRSHSIHRPPHRQISFCCQSNYRILLKRRKPVAWHEPAGLWRCATLTSQHDRRRA
jgi:hypothetical protein